MHNFKELRVWQEAMELAKAVYLETASFPANEKFGLISQINRAVISIASNIAEGAGRDSDKELSHFISIALGSAYELETQLLLAQRLGFIGNEASAQLIPQIERLEKMLYVFKKTISNKIKNSNTSY